MGPDNFDIGITSEDSVPDLEMLDLSEVPLWLVVFVIEESSVVDPEEILPPLKFGTSLPEKYNNFFSRSLK